MLIKTLYRAARHQCPRVWPLLLGWTLIQLVIWRGVVTPIEWRLDCARRSLARGAKIDKGA